MIIGKKISIKNEGFQLQHKEINKSVLNNLHKALFLTGQTISSTYCPRKPAKIRNTKSYTHRLVHSGRLLDLMGFMTKRLLNDFTGH